MSVTTATSEIVTVDPRDDPHWQSLTTGAYGSVFTSPPWIRAMCSTYGFTPEARVAMDPQGEPTGGFAWVPMEDLRGPRLISLPFCDWTDPMVSDQMTWEALADDLLDTNTPLTVRCLNAYEPRYDPRLEVAGEAAWHGTPLTGTVEDLWSRVASVARRNISKSRRKGVRIERSTGLDGVHRFHRLHADLRKRKFRMLAQPVDFFEHIWHEFASDDAILTLLAYLGDEPIGGLLLLEYNGVLYNKFAASVPEYLSYRPNDALYWEAIRCGLERSLRLVDWGRSDLDQPGLIRYKSKWATDERRIRTLRSAVPPSPERDEADGIFEALTELLTEPTVPDEITDRAGALLYRYFC